MDKITITVTEIPKSFDNPLDDPWINPSTRYCGISVRIYKQDGLEFMGLENDPNAARRKFFHGTDEEISKACIGVKCNRADEHTRYGKHWWQSGNELGTRIEWELVYDPDAVWLA